MSTAAATTKSHVIGLELASWLQRLQQALAALSPRAARQGRLTGSQVVRLASARGRRITCTGGALWLTFDGEPEDTVLEAGQSLLCTQDTTLLISSFGSAGWRAD